MPVFSLRTILGASAVLAFAAPALAHTPELPSAGAQGQASGEVMPVTAPSYDHSAYEQARAEWLSECRRNHGNGNMVGGAVVGGLIGGVVGNRIAGRGDRTLGTIAGAAVGAAAGGVIGDAADKRAARDYCETYLNRHTSYGYGSYGYPMQGYAMQPVMMMVPVAMVAAPQPQAQPQHECTETVVTEEWVDVPARRIIKRPPRRVPDKRVRIN